MAGEDQERFEDYLELERYIEELQAGRAAHPPTNLTPEQVRIYHMAALFRSAPPEAAEPQPEFVVSLYSRLLAGNDEAGQDPSPEQSAPAQPEQFAAIQKEQQEQHPITRQARKVPQRARSVSRRSLLSGGAVAAASLVVGTGIGAALEHGTQSVAKTAILTPYPTHTPDPPIVPADVATSHLVTTLAELGDRAVRFTTDTLVGYVMRSDGDNGEAAKGEIIAMSASCTHMGCIVKWQDADRSFHCPCHGGVFTEYGKPDNTRSRQQYLKALPRLQTLVQDGNVYVMVPRSSNL